MDKRTEIISTIERRRRWTAEEKLRILEEAFSPGATISAVADRNGVSRSLLHHWLRLVRAGRMPGISINRPASAKFVPVRIEAGDEAAASSPAPRSRLTSRRRISTIEIALGNGRVVKVEESIDPVRLARIVAALDGCGS
jgi:transposase